MELATVHTTAPAWLKCKIDNSEVFRGSAIAFAMSHHDIAMDPHVVVMACRGIPWHSRELPWHAMALS